jgi:FkbM family methyltransferase
MQNDLSHLFRRRPDFKDVKLPSMDGRIGSTWKRGRWYEGQMLDYIRDLELGGIYLDVGANVGNHTAYFATQTRAEMIFSFEPTEEGLVTLNKIIDDNGLRKRVTVIPYAAADVAGEFDIIENSATNVVPRRVKAVTIDEVAPPGVTLVKMDIEGSEPAALKGMRRVMLEDRPVLFIEAHTDGDKQAIEEIIGPLGYRATGRVFNASPTYEFKAVG